MSVGTPVELFDCREAFTDTLLELARKDQRVIAPDESFGMGSERAPLVHIGTMRAGSKPGTPAAERIHFDQAELLVPAHDRRAGAVSALVATNAAHPRVLAACRFAQHFDLAVEAALIGLALVPRPAVQRFVFRDGQLLRRASPVPSSPASLQR